MSGIFKTRRIPKHLIIQEELQFRPKGRFTIWRLTFWLVVFSLITFAALQLRVLLF